MVQEEVRNKLLDVQEGKRWTRRGENMEEMHDIKVSELRKEACKME